MADEKQANELRPGISTSQKLLNEQMSIMRKYQSEQQKRLTTRPSTATKGYREPYEQYQAIRKKVGTTPLTALDIGASFMPSIVGMMAPTMYKTARKTIPKFRNIAERIGAEKLAPYEGILKYTGAGEVFKKAARPAVAPMAEAAAPGLLRQIGESIGGVAFSPWGAALQVLGKAPGTVRKTYEAQAYRKYAKELGMAGAAGRFAGGISTLGRSVRTANLMAQLGGLGLKGVGGALGRAGAGMGGLTGGAIGGMGGMLGKAGAGLGGLLPSGGISSIPSLIGGPAMWGLIAAQTIGGMVGRSKLKKIMAVKKPGVQEAKKYSISDSLRGQINALTAQGLIQPTDQLKIFLLSAIETHLALVPELYSIVEYMSQKREKAGARIKGATKRLGQETREFAGITEMLQTFTAKFDPFTQLFNLILGGKTPKQMLETIRGGREGRWARKVHEIRAAKFGVSVSSARILTMNTGSFISKIGDLEDQKVTALIIQTQFQQLMARELVTLRKGMGIEENIFAKTAAIRRSLSFRIGQQVADAVQSIPGIAAIANVVGAAAEAARGVAKIASWGTKGLVKGVKWGLEGLGWTSTGLKDIFKKRKEELGKFEKAAGLQKTEREKAESFFAGPLPQLMSEYRSIFYSQLEKLEIIADISAKMYEATTKGEYKPAGGFVGQKERLIFDPATGTMVTDIELKGLERAREEARMRLVLGKKYKSPEQPREEGELEKLKQEKQKLTEELRRTKIEYERKKVIELKKATRGGISTAGKILKELQGVTDEYSVLKAAAKGGKFATGSAIVGERGPEIVTALRGGGVEVTGTEKTAKLLGMAEGGTLGPGMLGQMAEIGQKKEKLEQQRRIEEQTRLLSIIAGNTGEIEGLKDKLGDKKEGIPAIFASLKPLIFGSTFTLPFLTGGKIGTKALAQLAHKMTIGFVEWLSKHGKVLELFKTMGKGAVKIGEKLGIGKIGTILSEMGIKLLEKIGLKGVVKGAGKGIGKAFAKKIPFLGAVVGLGFGAQRALHGDWLGAAGEVASGFASLLHLIPGVGTVAALAISTGIDALLAIRDIAAPPEPKPSKIGNIWKKFKDWISDEFLSKKVIRKIPGLGSFLHFGEGISRFIQGDWKGGLTDIASGLFTAIPGVGTAVSMALDALTAKREKEKEEKGEKKIETGLFWQKLKEWSRKSFETFIFNIPVIGGFIREFVEQEGIKEKIKKAEEDKTSFWDKFKEYAAQKSKQVLTSIPGVGRLFKGMFEEEKPTKIDKHPVLKGKEQDKTYERLARQREMEKPGIFSRIGSFLGFGPDENDIRESAKDRTKQNEGMRLTKYRDILGKPTIGIGHLIRKDETFPDSITRWGALKLYDEDYAEHERDAASIPELGQLKKTGDFSRFYGAGVDLVFNMGKKGLSKFRGMLSAISKGDFNTAAKELLDSNYAKQVGQRAVENAEILRTGVIPGAAKGGFFSGAALVGESPFGRPGSAGARPEIVIGQDFAVVDQKTTRNLLGSKQDFRGFADGTLNWVGRARADVPRGMIPPEPERVREERRETTEKPQPIIVPVPQPVTSTTIPVANDQYRKETAILDKELENMIGTLFRTSHVALENILQDFAFGSSVQHKFY